jgi:hypothetical protein
MWDSIKIKLKYVVWEITDWIDLAQDRDGWHCEYSKGPSGSVMYREFLN